MSLIGTFIDRLLSTGSITLIAPGRRRRLRPGGGKHVTVSFTDRKVAIDIVPQPAAEARRALHGRAADHRGRDDPRPARADRWREPWEDKGEGRKALSKGKNRLATAASAATTCSERASNVAHHYDLRDELYELFLDDDRQYSCAYFTDPENSLEQAQADKKAHIAAKLDLKPGQRVLDIGCGWGGMALYLHKVAGVDVLGVTLSEEQLKIARAAGQGGGRLRPCEVRADRLPPARRHDSTASCRSACSSMSAPRIMTNSSPSAASC